VTVRIANGRSKLTCEAAAKNSSICVAFFVAIFSLWIEKRDITEFLFGDENGTDVVFASYFHGGLTRAAV
jgi:hypothetical protein